MHWRETGRETVWRGFMQLVVHRLHHQRFDGGESAELQREVLHRGEAVAVLPWDPTLDAFLLVEQFRPGAIGRVAGPWILETVAGMIEPGESAESVARREAAEEAGLCLDALRPMLDVYPSPGGSTERIKLYLAETSLAGAGGLFGLENEGEDIRALVMPTAEAIARLESGEIDNAMTVIALQWWMLYARDIDAG